MPCRERPPCRVNFSWILSFGDFKTSFLKFDCFQSHLQHNPSTYSINHARTSHYQTPAATKFSNAPGPMLIHNFWIRGRSRFGIRLGTEIESHEQVSLLIDSYYHFANNMCCYLRPIHFGHTISGTIRTLYPTGPHQLGEWTLDSF